MLNRRFDLVIENCLHCGKCDVRLTRDTDMPDGSIYMFDLCLDCDDMVSKIMTYEEGMSTLYRVTAINDLKAYR